MAEQSTPTRGGVRGSYVVNPYQVNVSYGNPAARITTGTGADWFGPLDPMRATAPPEVAGRQWDFQAGYNLATVPRSYEPVSFATLRALADAYDVLRTVIETRKDQVARMNWTIRARASKAGAAPDPRIAASTKFLHRPDGLHCWADWIRILLEDLFVIDAPALYMQRTRAGRLIALHPLDGSTIKPVIDDWGRTPRDPAAAAYQQTLKGLPAVDYSIRDLLYRPRNMRVHKAYGFSPVEQIVTTVNIALRKQLFNLNYYTEGNVPDALIGTPDDWTPDQIGQYQKYWDAYFEGDLARRRKAKFVPGKLSVQMTKEPDLKNEFDEWLARIVCFAFSISPQPFIKMMNRGSADTSRKMSEEEGLVPILDWLKALIDDILEIEFDAEDLEFYWESDDATDEAAQYKIVSGYTGQGILTINEARALLGKPPFEDVSANEPMVLTPNGLFPIGANTIEGRKEQIAAGIMPDPEKPPPPPKAIEANPGNEPGPAADKAAFSLPLRHNEEATAGHE